VVRHVNSDFSFDCIVLDSFGQSILRGFELNFSHKIDETYKFSYQIREMASSKLQAEGVAELVNALVSQNPVLAFER